MSHGCTTRAEVMDLQQVAAYLQLSPITVYRLMKEEPPALPGRKVGGQWRFLRHQIDDFLYAGWEAVAPRPRT